MSESVAVRQLAVVVVGTVFALGCQGNRSEPTPTVSPNGTTFSSARERFTAVSGTGDNDIWAVGSREEPGTWAIRHWDGAVWTDLHTTAPAAPLDVWARAVDDVWVVGLEGAALHWQGTGWVATDTTSIKAPGTGEISPHCDGSFDVCHKGETSLHSVFSVAPNDVWAVGYAYPTTTGPALIVHYDGTTWTRFPVDAPDGLLKVWGTSSTDVWAAGSQGITLHWDGTAWTSVDGGTQLYRYGMWGSSKDDIWAVGNKGAITRFDGRAWSPVSEADWTELKAVSGSGPNDVWAVGRFFGPRAIPDEPVSGRFLARWDGDAWTTCRVPGKSGLSAVWVSPTGRAWATSGSIEELAFPDPSECEH